jgi:hypothetical protein
MGAFRVEGGLFGRLLSSIVVRGEAAAPSPVLFGPPSADRFVSWFLAVPFVQVNLLAVWATGA